MLNNLHKFVAMHLFSIEQVYLSSIFFFRIMFHKLVNKVKNICDIFSNILKASILFELINYFFVITLFHKQYWNDKSKVSYYLSLFLVLIKRYSYGIEALYICKSYMDHILVR